MCQGVIVSLIEFNDKQVVLSGIGSHSDMLKANKQLLIDRGWAEDDENQKVFSIESDFKKGYGKFTIESGRPDEKQLELLTREYLNCAGSDRQLIDHVKRCVKIDDSLVKLLTENIRRQYEKVRAPFEKQYQKARVPILKQYQEARAIILKQYDEAHAPIWERYFEACAPIEKQYQEARAPIEKKYNEAIAPIEKQYYEARAPIEKKYNEAIAPIEKQYYESVAPIEKQYNEAIAPIWISLFENSENRIDVMK